MFLEGFCCYLLGCKMSFGSGGKVEDKDIEAELKDDDQVDEATDLIEEGKGGKEAALGNEHTFKN